MEYSKEEKTLLWLDSFALDYTKKLQIYQLNTQLYQIILQFKQYASKIEAIVGEDCLQKMQNSLLNGKYMQKLLAMYEKEKIICITIKTDIYPKAFLEIDTPPLVLYCKGNLQLFTNRKFAIVGSRQTLPNILKITEEFSKKLSSVFTIVTGIADGADRAVIEGADITNCIVILAHGFAYCSPERNRNILQQVMQNGLVVTEYPPTISLKAYHFYARNRLIAALTEGVLIVSAGQKSGAKITANYAFQYGKALFALPYSLGISSGIGCNQLIQKCATLCTNVFDITEAFGIHLNTEREVLLTAIEKNILEVIQNGNSHIMQIMQVTGIASYELPALLTSLELKKLITSCGGNRYMALV